MQLRRKVCRIWCPLGVRERVKTGAASGARVPPVTTRAHGRCFQGDEMLTKLSPCTSPLLGGQRALPLWALGRELGLERRDRRQPRRPLYWGGLEQGLEYSLSNGPREPGHPRPAKTASGWNGFWVPSPRRRLIFLINSEAMKQGMRLEWAGQLVWRRCFLAKPAFIPPTSLTHPQIPCDPHSSNDHCGHSRLNSKAVWQCDEKQRLWNQIDSGPNLKSRSDYCCCCLVAKLYLTLCDPVDCSPPVSSVHRISQARILEWAAISFSRGSSWPRDGTHTFCLTGGFFTTEPPGKPSEFGWTT